MANAIYPKFKELILDSDTIDLNTDTVKAYLVRGYTYSSAHDTLDDVTGAGGTLVASVTLTGVTLTNGVFDCNDWTWPTVAAGAPCQAFIIVKDTGTPGTSFLVYYCDTQTGLPVTPNGADITYTVDNGANKLFSL